MNAICVDDEELVLFRTVSLVKKTKIFDQVFGFTEAKEALSSLDTEEASVALLDIDMPEIKGLELASRMKEKRPGIRIIFLTGYSEYAVDAYAMHATGYLLKPIGFNKLQAELNYAIGNSGETKAPEPAQATRKVKVETFGFFNVLVNEKPVSFRRAKAKELLACLVDRKGQFVSRKDLFYILWEDDDYDRAKQKYFDTIIRSLKETLEEYGISDVFEVEKGMMRVVPEKIDCDLYRFLAKDRAALDSFRGEYMNSYSWAEETEGYLAMHS